MANLSHVLRWDDLRKVFTCRTGACAFSKTWAEIEKAGYQPTSTHTVFVEENDFTPLSLVDGAGPVACYE